MLFYFVVAPFVPSNFAPLKINKADADNLITLICPFNDAGNPPPVCTWRRFDSDNTSHSLSLHVDFVTRIRNEQSQCIISIFFGERYNGLYQCTGRNEVGNTTYTFPTRFIVESKYSGTSIIPFKGCSYYDVIKHN